MSLSRVSPDEECEYDTKKSWTKEQAKNAILEELGEIKRTGKVVSYHAIDCRSAALVYLGLVISDPDYLLYVLLLLMGVKFSTVQKLIRKFKHSGKKDFHVRYLIHEGINTPDYNGSAIFLRDDRGMLFFIKLLLFVLFVFIDLCCCLFCMFLDLGKKYINLRDHRKKYPQEIQYFVSCLQRELGLKLTTNIHFLSTNSNHSKLAPIILEAGVELTKLLQEDVEKNKKGLVKVNKRVDKVERAVSKLQEEMKVIQGSSEEETQPPPKYEEIPLEEQPPPMEEQPPPTEEQPPSSQLVVSIAAHRGMFFVCFLFVLFKHCC